MRPRGRGLAEVEHVRYVNLPLQPKAALSPEQVAQGLATNLYDDYVLQVRDNGAQLLAGLELLAEDGALPAVVHCTAGKDRTGVLVALLLDLLGVEREAVVADYAETTANMPGILARIRESPYFRSNGLAAAPDWIFSSEPATMRDFLAFMDAELGGTAHWAASSGLSAARSGGCATGCWSPDRQRRGAAARPCRGRARRGRASRTGARRTATPAPCAGSGRRSGRGAARRRRCPAG